MDWDAGKQSLADVQATAVHEGQVVLEQQDALRVVQRRRPPEVAVQEVGDHPGVVLVAEPPVGPGEAALAPVGAAAFSRAVRRNRCPNRNWPDSSRRRNP